MPFLCDKIYVLFFIFFCEWIKLSFQLASNYQSDENGRLFTHDFDVSEQDVDFANY
jgi:hypothetical protein